MNVRVVPVSSSRLVWTDWMVMSVCVDSAIRALSVTSLSHVMMIHVSMAVSVTTQWIDNLIRWLILLILYMRMTMFFAMYYTSMTPVGKLFQTVWKENQAWTFKLLRLSICQYNADTIQYRCTITLSYRSWFVRQKMVCDCAAGYNGTYCEHETDECSTSPCLHGLCIDRVNDYTCFCQNGWKVSQ